MVHLKIEVFIPFSRSHDSCQVYKCVDMQGTERAVKQVFTANPEILDTEIEIHRPGWALGGHVVTKEVGPQFYGSPKNDGTVISPPMLCQTQIWRFYLFDSCFWVFPPKSESVNNIGVG